MTNNDLPLTEAILAAKLKLREIEEANRAGVMYEITECADDLGTLANFIRARSIALHFAKPMQDRPVEIEEEVE